LEVLARLKLYVAAGRAVRSRRAFAPGTLIQRAKRSSYPGTIAELAGPGGIWGVKQCLKRAVRGIEIDHLMGHYLKQMAYQMVFNRSMQGGT